MSSNLVEKLDELTSKYGAPMSLMSDCIRGFIVPDENHVFVAADFSAIEARVLAWLAGEEKIIAIFRGDGKVYEHEASRMFKVPIDQVNSEQRQFGKIANLAFGYGGGKGAFQRTAKKYGVSVSDAQAEEIKIKWREANKKTVFYWYELEKAAMYAVSTGIKKPVGKIFFKVIGSALWCTLPSGRKICYMYPKIKEVKTPWGDLKDALVYKRKEEGDTWREISTYGGKLCENITQAIARDIQAEAMLRVEKSGFPIVLHVHDEIVTEIVNKSEGILRFKLAYLIKIMTLLPYWAEGLPLAAAGWISNRYQKD